jgi:hypothetical protein
MNQPIFLIIPDPLPFFPMGYDCPVGIAQALSARALRKLAGHSYNSDACAGGSGASNIHRIN